MIVLVGDIGGTNIRLGLIRLDGDNTTLTLLDEQRFSSKAFPSLGDAVEAYVAKAHASIDAAGFGVAAPIQDGECRGPNLPWAFSERELSAAARVSHVTLVNDFAALGTGIPFVPASGLLTLQAGISVPRGPIALIGAGTGLGEGFLTWNNERYVAHASEGGHVTFAPRTEREWAIAQYLQAQFGHVSYERILSGYGLVSLYHYFIDVERFSESEHVRTAMQQSDPAAAITRAALDGTDAACVETVELFLHIYGAQAGNLALTVLPTGGVYVAGGIAAHLTERLQNGVFLQAFHDKGRMSAVLHDIPVHVVVSQTAALYGAAVLAVNPSSGVA